MSIPCEPMHGRLRAYAGAQWMATNLKPIKGGQLDWTFDLKGINELCGSWSKPAVLAAPWGGDPASRPGLLKDVPARGWAALVRTREGRLSRPGLHEGQPCDDQAPAHARALAHSTPNRYGSYEQCDLWPMLETQPKGLQVQIRGSGGGGWWELRQ